MNVFFVVLVDNWESRFYNKKERKSCKSWHSDYFLTSHLVIPERNNSDMIKYEQDIYISTGCSLQYDRK